MAAGRLLIPSWMPALDSDGNPIPNARVYFYVNKTSTLSAIYSDEALTLPLTNPVPANSSGRFPAIWASDAALYSWSIDAPYGPAGIPFTGDDLSVSVSSEVLVLESIESATSASEEAATRAETAYEEILEIAASAPDAPSVVNKLDLDGDNVGASAPALLANIGAIPLNAKFVSTIPLPAATQPNIELFVQSTTAGNDGILIHMDATTASSGSYTFHGLYTAGAGVVNGGGIGVAANGVGTANAGVFNRYEAGDGSGILTNRVGSGNGYGATLNFSSTGTGGALFAVKQNSNGLPGGIAGVGPAARIENNSESGYAIDSSTASNNAETISHVFTRNNFTGGVNMDVRNLAGGARTTARTGLYIREAPSTASTGTFGVTGIAVELGPNFTGSVETIGLSMANNSAGNTTGYGMIAVATGANGVNYGGMFSASGATGANIAIRGNGNIWTIGGFYFVDGVKVVGTQKTGWGVDTGTAKRTANATYTAGAAITAPTGGATIDAESRTAIGTLITRLAAVETALQNDTQKMKAIVDDLHATTGHGLIGS